MDFWFSEMHTDNVKMSIRVEKQLFSSQSDFQRIDVFDSLEFGRFLTSDGSVIFSEKDEFTYDEMIVHVPMAVHPCVRRVLVIGGGDGGVARELSHYGEIETIDVVEPDKLFVDVCRKYFPDNACGLDDSRVRIFYEDGLRFLRSKKDDYDLIINDCTDPLGHELKIHKLPIPDVPVCCSEADCAAYSFEPGEDTRVPGERLAASYVNFYFSNDAVLLPQFGGANAESDRRAVKIMTALCPGRRIIPINARAILQGGGNIHCITQQIPKGEPQ